MDAQLIVVFQNGYIEARDPNLRDRFEVIGIEKAEDIKVEITKQLKRIGRKGHVLVRWNGKTYHCEMKSNGNYIRTEIDYHPHLKHFTI